MFSRLILPAVFYFAFSAFLQPYLHANGGGYTYGVYQTGSAGVSTDKTLALFTPKNVDQIEMQTEKLNIDLHVEYAEIEVEYTLHNPGKTVTVEAGFPFTNVLSGFSPDGGEPKSTDTAVKNFRLEVDGKALDTKEIHGKPVDSRREDVSNPDMIDVSRLVGHWFVFNLPFKKGRTLTLKAAYRVAYGGDLFSVSDDEWASSATLTYIFSAAALWKGPIREGTVTIRAASIDPDQVVLNLSSRFQRADRLWQWKFKDLEPTLADDLQIVTHPGYRGYSGNYYQINGKWEGHDRSYNISASSTLQGDYSADHLKNWGPDQPWVEGAPDDGLGEWLTISLDKSRKVSHINVVNGFAKSEELYAANNRVAEFAVSINGAKPFTVTLPDERLERQTFPIVLPKDTPPVNTIKLTIQKVYPGTKYRDSCISRIELVTPLSKKPEIQPAR